MNLFYNSTTFQSLHIKLNIKTHDLKYFSCQLFITYLFIAFSCYKKTEIKMSWVRSEYLSELESEKNMIGFFSGIGSHGSLYDAFRRNQFLQLKGTL